MTFNTKRYKLARRTSILVSIIIDFFVVSLLYLMFNLNNIDNNNYIIVVIGLLLPVALYFTFMRKYIRRKKVLEREFPQEWEEILQTHVMYYSSLSEEEKCRFRQAIQIFLAEKLITGIETEVDNTCKVLVAVSAIIPIFRFPDWEYDKLSEVLIYPSNFNDDFDFTQKNSRYLGMVGIGGAMILSKPALYEGFKYATDRMNVGIHEFAHKVDEKDGVFDGIPSSLITKEIEREWVSIMHSEMEKLAQGESEDINLYALTNEIEFFAVVSEYFFENPQGMEKRHPELYRILVKIFRQDTKTMFKRVIKSIFLGGKKKIGRNSRCPCGSGKKYKHCCLKKKKSFLNRNMETV